MKKIVLLASLLYAAVVITFAVGVSPAAAQEGNWLGGLEAPLVELASAIILAITGYVLTWLREKWNLEIEAKHRAALQSALTNAATLAIKAALDKDTGGKTGKDAGIEIGTAAMEIGIDYVKQSVPDAIRKFGLDTILIDRLLRPKINEILLKK